MPSPLASAVASDLDPIIVTSPTIRSGTTLLQRLLCSSSNALIYGEECGKDLELFIQLYAHKVAVYSAASQRFSNNLQQVLDGDVNDWILNLMPEIDGYLKALGQASFGGIAYCRDYARTVDRPIWGVKYPSWSPQLIRTIRQVMPRSRFVFIWRDVADCLRSAKARGSVNSGEDARYFCATWATNLTFMRAMRSEASVLLVNYVDLVTAPAKTIATLAEFSGIRDMRIETLNHKINNWVGPEIQATNQPGYIEPVALDDFEKRLAAEAAAAVDRNHKG